MDSQSSQIVDQNCPNYNNQKVQYVAQQLLKAMGDQASGDSNVIVFLNKLYKNNTAANSKKMKSIRLNRFVGLLETVISSFPTQKDDIHILFQIVTSTLLNQRNFADEEDDQLVIAMAHQFALVIEKISQIQSTELAFNLLQLLIKGKTDLALSNSNDFYQKIKKSSYYQNLKIDTKKQTHPTQKRINYSILDSIEINSVIINNLNIQIVYGQIFRFYKDKFEVIKTFYQHVKKLEKHKKPRKKMFFQCFLSNQNLVVSEAQAILQILDRQLFDQSVINEIVNMVVQKLPLKYLMEINLKKIKGIEQIFIQVFIQAAGNINICDVIQAFINSKQNDNYFALYVILKLRKKIPLSYVDILFNHKIFTIKKSIIFTLTIFDNQISAIKQLLKLFKLSLVNRDNLTINKLSLQKMILKSIHFALQNISKAELISLILKYIQKRDLNSECQLQYLKYYPVRANSSAQIKQILTQQNKQIVQQLLSHIKQQNLIRSSQSIQINQNISSLSHRNSSQSHKNSFQSYGKQSQSYRNSQSHRKSSQSHKKQYQNKKNSSQTNLNLFLGNKYSIQANNSLLDYNENKILQTKSILIKSNKISNEQSLHKLKIDIQVLFCGNLILEQQIMANIKQLNTILGDSPSFQQVLIGLPNYKDNLLEVILMWINNQYQTFYSQDINNNIIDWTLKNIKKYSNDLINELKILLQKEKLDKYYNFFKAIINYGIEKRQSFQFANIQKNKIFNSQIRSLINSSNITQERMNNVNFTEYFLSQSKWKNHISSTNPSQKVINKIIWIKTIIIQLKNLIKNLVKAEKVGNRKEIKNIITENVEDIYALKIIHQYFDCQIEEGKQIIVHIFKQIPSQFQFFQKTQKLAASLNQQFYPIFQQLPYLLESFNSESLNFLAKLLMNKKKQVEDKKNQKGKNKKQKQKDQHLNEETKNCLQIVSKNLSLLFTDANSSHSYKNLFIILKKLIQNQKVSKDEVHKNVNSWLLQINFFSCPNFQSWKNKVMSLSKMWKDMTDLLDDKKIDTKAIEKHFNLFTDLLNKHYENYREEKQFLELQQRILICLCLIYKQLDFSNQIETQVDMTRLIAQRFQQKNMSKIILQNRYYYCNQCKKYTCYACSSFLHRNHDKTYLAKKGICQHENVQTKKQAPVKVETNSLSYNGASNIFRRGGDDDQMFEKFITHKLSSTDHQLQFLTRIKQSQNLRDILDMEFPRSKIEKVEQLRKKIRQKQAALNVMQQMKKNQDQPIQQQNQDSLTPLAEAYFQYKKPYCKQYKKISPQFQAFIPKLNIPQPQINMSPLAKVFLRELQNNSFIYRQVEDQSPQNGKKDGLKVQEIQEKYLFFKITNLRVQARDNSFGRSRGGGGTGPGGYAQYYYGNHPNGVPHSNKRNVLTANKKSFFYPSNMMINSVSATLIKQKLQKKQLAKEFNNYEMEKHFMVTQPTNLPFEILQASISKSLNHPVLAIVGHNQIGFYPLQADGKYMRMLNPQFQRIDNIVKFVWINQSKNMFGIAYTNYIRIGGVSPSNNVKTFAKAQIGKQIKDFDGFMTSKTHSVFIIDNQGRLYFVQSEFKQARNSNYNPNDKIINIIDQNDKKVVDFYSVKCIDHRKIMLSCADGSLRIINISRQTNTWKSKTINLKKIINIQSTIVLDSIKIIKQQEDSIIFSALCRKINHFQVQKPRRHLGSVCIIKYKDNEYTQISMTKQENIQSYDFYVISPENIMFSYCTQEGSILFFRKKLQFESAQIVEKVEIRLTNKQLNEQLVAHNFFNHVKQGGMIKNLEFKQNSNLTDKFNINIKQSGKQKNEIKISQKDVNYSYFLSGLLFTIDIPSIMPEYGQQINKSNKQLAEVDVKILNSTYTFKCYSKSRDVQIAFNIKQTLELFAHQNQLKFQYNFRVCLKETQIKDKAQDFLKVNKITLFGLQYKSNSQPTAYSQAYNQLISDWSTYQSYQKQGLQQYFNNIYRFDLHNLEMKKFYKMKYDNANQGTGFKNKQINLFLKIQLLTQSVGQCISLSSTSKQDPLQYLNYVKRNLFYKKHQRKSLQNSSYRLCEVLCQIYNQQSIKQIGHPYNKSSMLNFHYFSVCYQNWQNKKSFGLFQKLCNELSRLIFTQFIDIYIILQVYPNLILDISIYFHHLISEKRNNQFDEDIRLSVAKLCSKFVSIICEYYQLLKNQQIQLAQQKILNLLEQIFGKSKSDMSKQMVMNPFSYLQSLQSDQKQKQIKCGVDLFKIRNLSSIELSLESNISPSSQKINKPIKKQIIIYEPEVAKNLPNWEAMEQQKQMYEDDKLMYMEIQDDFAEEDEPQGMDLDEIIDQQNKKDSYSPNTLQNLNQILLQGKQKSNDLISLDESMTKTLMQKLVNTNIPMKYYDFSLQLAIALFRKQNYLTSSNIYFYLGLLYSLLKIIEDNLNLKKNHIDRSNLMRLVKIIDCRLESFDHSSLFMIINYFVSPKYVTENGIKVMHKSDAKITQCFVQFYQQNPSRFLDILTKYEPNKISNLVKFSQVMRFQSFQLQNQLNNLSLIGNIYMGCKLSRKVFNSQDQTKIKEEILFKVVKYKVPIFKNIMLFENWKSQLDRAKILVGYDKMTSKNPNSYVKQEGINILYECAKLTPHKFIEQLLKDENKINVLQELALLQDESNESHKKLFQLLDIYYRS